MDQKPKSTSRLVHFEPSSQPTLKPLPTVWDRERSRIFKNNFIQKNIQKVSPTVRLRGRSVEREKCLNKLNNCSNLIKQQQCAKEENASLYSSISKPSSIYRFNSFIFLNSLRDYSKDQQHFNKMSKPDAVVDSFVKMKTAEFESMTNGHDSKKHSPSDENGVKETLYKKRSLNSSSNVHSSAFVGARRGSNYFRSRPKSSYGRQNRLLNSSQTSKSTPKLNRLENDVEFDDNNGNKSENDLEDEDGDGDVYEYDNNDEDFEPYFHRSLDKISSIANWERQIRYELEIEKELQRRELDRQKEKLQSDQRKLEEWDKQLRIELDARERKVRLTEDEYKSRLDEFEQRSKDLMRKEQMINEIVAERIKAEMKFEIEKLRKKFNELEVEKSNLNKKEERVKEVEARLHEQVKIVKEKIDGKRLSDIELAKYKKELEILKKENEVLKDRVDTMDDYQVNKFENRALKSELQILKDSLDSKSQELERERDRWEKEQRATDQKILNLRADLRQAEQELVIYKQKSQGDLDEMTSKFEATNGQLKRIQIFVKDLLAKINSGSPGSIGANYHQKTVPTVQYSKISPNTSYFQNHHHHRRHKSLSGSGHLHGPRPATRSTSGLGAFYSSPNGAQTAGFSGHSIGGRNISKGVHQRSISMDEHDLMSFRRKGLSTAISQNNRQLRGCNLCEDYHDEEYLHENELSQSNEFLAGDSESFYNHSEYPEQRAIDNIFEEEPFKNYNRHDLQHYSEDREDIYPEQEEEEEEETEEEEKKEDHERNDKIIKDEQISNQNIPSTSKPNQTDEVVDKIVSKIYEKIHSSKPPTKGQASLKSAQSSDFLKNDNLLISKLLASMTIEHVQNDSQNVTDENVMPSAHSMNFYSNQNNNSQNKQHFHQHHSSHAGEVMHSGITPSDSYHHHQYHYQQQQQQQQQQSPVQSQRIASNSHNYKNNPSSEQANETSLYEELLPFASQGLPISINSNLPVPVTIAKNDNNNNSLLVATQQKTSPPKTIVSNVNLEPIHGQVTETVSGTSAQIINVSSSEGADQNVNDISNKPSDGSSKSESFEVDW